MEGERAVGRGERRGEKGEGGEGSRRDGILVIVLCCCRIVIGPKEMKCLSIVEG